jgi:hypothetical protein
MGAGVGMGRAWGMAMGGQERKDPSFNFSQDGKVIVTPEYNSCCLSHLVPRVTSSFFRFILWKHASKVFWRPKRSPLHIFGWSVGWSVNFSNILGTALDSEMNLCSCCMISDHQI